MFKTELALCIFCLQLREPGPQRAARRGEPGQARNSCERPLDLPFLTLQQPTRRRFMTAGEGETGGREEKGTSKRRNETNIQRREDGVAEMRCGKESKTKGGKKVKHTEEEKKKGQSDRGENKMADRKRVFWVNTFKAFTHRMHNK